MKRRGNDVYWRWEYFSLCEDDLDNKKQRQCDLFVEKAKRIILTEAFCVNCLRQNTLCLGEVHGTKEKKEITEEEKKLTGTNCITSVALAKSNVGRMKMIIVH